MSKERKRLQKKKARDKRAKQRVLNRRSIIRDTAKLEKEADRMAWDHRERLTPIRNPKKLIDKLQAEV